MRVVQLLSRRRASDPDLLPQDLAIPFCEVCAGRAVRGERLTSIAAITFVAVVFAQIAFGGHHPAMVPFNIAGGVAFSYWYFAGDPWRFVIERTTKGFVFWFQQRAVAARFAELNGIDVR